MDVNLFDVQRRGLHKCCSFSVYFLLLGLGDVEKVSTSSYLENKQEPCTRYVT